MGVAISTTQEVVEAGLRVILERAEAEAPFQIVTTGPDGGEPDVILFDVIHLRHGNTLDLERWLKYTATIVIAIDRTLKPELGQQAREAGVEWSIDLGITAPELVTVIQEAIAGTLEDSTIAAEWDPDYYPGQDVGLSPREAEVMRWVVAGRSNQEIADELYLSINSIKTYIRASYRKIGVTTRTQAVMWCVENGFPATGHEA